MLRGEPHAKKKVLIATVYGNSTVVVVGGPTFFQCLNNPNNSGGHISSTDVSTLKMNEKFGNSIPEFSTLNNLNSPLTVHWKNVYKFAVVSANSTFIQKCSLDLD